MYRSDISNHIYKYMTWHDGPNSWCSTQELGDFWANFLPGNMLKLSLSWAYASAWTCFSAALRGARVTHQQEVTGGTDIPWYDYHDMIRQKVHHDASRLMPRFAVDAQVWIPVDISNLEDLVAIAYPGLKTTRHGYPKFWCFINVDHVFPLKRTSLDHFGESLFGWLNPPFLPRLCRLPSLHPSVHDERLKRLAQEAWHDWTAKKWHGSKGWKRRPVLWVSYVFIPSSSSRFFICLFILFLFFGPRSQEMILGWQKNRQVIPENHRCWLNAMTCPWVPWWKWPRCPAAVQSGVGVDEAIHRYP